MVACTVVRTKKMDVVPLSFKASVHPNCLEGTFSIFSSLLFFTCGKSKSKIQTVLLRGSNQTSPSSELGSVLILSWKTEQDLLVIKKWIETPESFKSCFSFDVKVDLKLLMKDAAPSFYHRDIILNGLITAITSTQKKGPDSYFIANLTIQDRTAVLVFKSSDPLKILLLRSFLTLNHVYQLSGLKSSKFRLEKDQEYQHVLLFSSESSWIQSVSIHPFSKVENNAKTLQRYTKLLADPIVEGNEVSLIDYEGMITSSTSSYYILDGDTRFYYSTILPLSIGSIVNLTNVHLVPARNNEYFNLVGCPFSMIVVLKYGSKACKTQAQKKNEGYNFADIIFRDEIEIALQNLAANLASFLTIGSGAKVPNAAW